MICICSICKVPVKFSEELPYKCPFCDFKLEPYISDRDRGKNLGTYDFLDQQSFIFKTMTRKRL